MNPKSTIKGKDKDNRKINNRSFNKSQLKIDLKPTIINQPEIFSRAVKIKFTKRSFFQKSKSLFIYLYLQINVSLDKFFFLDEFLESSVEFLESTVKGKGKNNQKRNNRTFNMPQLKIELKLVNYNYNKST